MFSTHLGLLLLIVHCAIAPPFLATAIMVPLASSIAGSLTALLALLALATTSSQTSCGFCPNGSPPLNPSALLDPSNDNRTTCGDAHNTLLSSFAPGGQCIFAQTETILDLEGGYPAQCGYCAVPADEVDATCLLCPTGDIPSLPADTVVTLPDGTVSTCGEITYLTQRERIFSDQCLELQTAAASCGCEPTECTICPDGGPMPDPSKWSFAAEMPCGDVVRDAADLEPTSDECRTMQTIVMGECGCDYVPPYEPGCTMCTDGGVVPDPTFQLFPGDELSTCGLYGWYAALPPFGTGDERCSAMQSTFGAACGCDDAPEPPCGVSCTVPGEVFNATHVVADFEVGDALYLFEGYHNCAEILFEMSVKQDEICTFGAIRDLEDVCCMEPYVPPPPEEEVSDSSEAGYFPASGLTTTAIGLMAGITIVWLG